VGGREQRSDGHALDPYSCHASSEVQAPDLRWANLPEADDTVKICYFEPVLRHMHDHTNQFKGTLRCRLSHMFFCARLKVDTFGIILQ